MEVGVLVGTGVFVGGNGVAVGVQVGRLAIGAGVEAGFSAAPHALRSRIEIIRRKMIFLSIIDLVRKTNQGSCNSVILNFTMTATIQATHLIGDYPYLVHVAPAVDFRGLRDLESLKTACHHRRNSRLDRLMGNHRPSYFWNPR